MLAYCLEKYPLELRADFQEYYGLNIDGMGWQYTTLHAADLTRMLPRQSRLFCAIDPANAWGQTEELLAGIHYYSHVNAWSKSKEAQQKKKPPFDPPKPPTKKKEQKQIDVTAIKEHLALPRR